jgi:hypothetical protein
MEKAFDAIAHESGLLCLRAGIQRTGNLAAMRRNRGP